MMTPSKKIWMDGEFVDWDKASVHVLTHSLHYGLAAGNAMLPREDQPFFAEHVDRRISAQ